MNKKNFFYIALIFWIGFSSLIYEIYSTRVLFLFFTQTNWAITIAISAFLGGLAFSSLIFSRIAQDTTRNSLKIILWMQLAVAAYGFLLLRNYALIPQAIDSLLATSATDWLVVVFKIALMWLYLFIPAFFIGGSFPLVNGLYLQGKKEATTGTGLIYFWDTIGAILGSLVTGFVLLPFLGLNLTMIIACGLNLLIALVIAPTRRWRMGVVLLIIIFAGMAWYSNHNNSNRPGNQDQLGDANLIQTSEGENLEERFGDILFQEQSPYGLVTIGNNAMGIEGIKGLFINYRDMCYNKSPSKRAIGPLSEIAIASLTTEKLQPNSRVLNMGLGCGLTAHTVESSPNVESLDIAEINPVVVKGASQFFKEENGDVLNSPKTTLYVQDGAEFIRNSKDLYDAIIIDIEEPTIVESSPLYTAEYFDISHKHLEPGGILALWAQKGSPEFGKVIYNTLQSKFKYVSIRILSSCFTFYASDSKHDFSTDDPREKDLINEILNSPVKDINTLDNQVLGKYFDINTFFGLPTDYTEDTYIK